MSVEASQPLKITRAAGADLSALQYCFVKEDSNGNAVAVTAATDTVIGVLQNKPSAAGRAAEIVVVGVTKALCVGVIAVGANVAPDANGLFQTASPTGFGGSYVQGTKQSVGYLYSTAATAANDIATAVVNCLSPVPAT